MNAILAEKFLGKMIKLYVELWINLEPKYS
jgi:hypothetical protein